MDVPYAIDYPGHVTDRPADQAMTPGGAAAGPGRNHQFCASQRSAASRSTVPGFGYALAAPA